MTTQPEVPIIYDHNVGVRVHACLGLVEKSVAKAKAIAAIPEINGGNEADAWLRQHLADAKLYIEMAQEAFAQAFAQST
jgi:hypothetical protein